jgi:hypothetical protein
MGKEAYDKTGETDNQFGFKVNTPFLLRSRLPMQRVMECYGASYTSQKSYYKNRKAQLWTFDPVSKTIRNKNWTNYAMSTASDWLRCQPFNSRWFQLFKWQAPTLSNEKDLKKVASVQSALDTEKKYIYMRKREGKQHQQWDLIYQKDWVEEPGKGKMNTDFGLRVDTDFHIVSTLG